MKRFERIELNLSVLSRELDELAKFLADNTALKERAQVIPFFKRRRQLSAAIGYFHSEIARPDRVAPELSLFGDFTCDMAIGDSTTSAFLLVEFEDAETNSIFIRA
jgi:hypothetical protein